MKTLYKYKNLKMTDLIKIINAVQMILKLNMQNIYLFPIRYVLKFNRI